MKRSAIKLQTLFVGNSLQAKISKGIAWSFLGTLISKGSMLIAFAFVARLISIEEYGQVGVIRNAIGTFAAFSVMSFGITATKYLAIYKDTDVIRAEKILTFTRSFVLVSSIMISIGIYFFADLIALKMMNNPTLTYYVQLSSIAIFFTALNGYQNGLLAGLEKFKELSMINVVNGFLTFPILIISAYFWQVSGIIIGLMVISFLTWLMSDYYVRSAMKANSLNYRFHDIATELPTITHFALPSFLSSISITPAILMTNVILAHQPNGYHQLGIFNAAYFFSIITSTINGVMGQVLYPYAMQQFKKENRKFEYFNIISPWMIGIILNLPLIIFPGLMVIFFGSKYDTDDFKISVMLVALFSIIIAHRSGIARNFAAADLMWWSVFGNGFWGIALVSLSYYLASYGAIGITLAFLIAYILNSIIFLPLYLSKGLIDKTLLTSKPTLIIWFFLISSPFIYLLTNNTFVKFIFLLILFILISNSFLTLWKTHIKAINMNNKEL
jgi:O-antigen/teichoic acid export membrane protein